MKIVSNRRGSEFSIFSTFFKVYATFNMPALFEDMITKMYPKLLRNVWLLKIKDLKLNHLMDKCFYIVNWLQEVLNIGILSLFWYTSTLISSLPFHGGKWTWSFFSGSICISFEAFLAETTQEKKIKISFYQAPESLKMYSSPTMLKKHALVYNLFYFKSCELCKIMILSSFERIWELTWME